MPSVQTDDYHKKNNQALGVGNNQRDQQDQNQEFAKPRDLCINGTDSSSRKRAWPDNGFESRNSISKQVVKRVQFEDLDKSSDNEKHST